MVSLGIGAIVLVNFPFSGLSSSKLRPAIVLAKAGRDDWILCQITSKPYADTKAIEINDSDFISGSLLKKSYARIGKLFTANSGIIIRTIGQLAETKITETLEAVASLFIANVSNEHS